MNPSQSTVRLSNDPNYRRLFKGTSSPLSTASGWLGNGHLLFVEIQLYAETYSRIALHDIEAVIVRPTRTGLITAIIVGIFFLVTALPGAGAIGFSLISGNSAPVWGIVFSVIGVVFLAILLFCLRGFHSCQVLIKTAVQTRHIPGLRTRRNAERFIATIRSELAQSTSTPTNPASTASREAAMDAPPEAVLSSIAPTAPDHPSGHSPESRLSDPAS